MAWTRSRNAAVLTVVCLAILAMGIGEASAMVTPPVGRALELPPGVSSLSANDSLLAPILSGATTTGAGPVVHDQVGKTLPLGKTLVTWRDLSDNSTAVKYVYLYPYGWQVLGPATNLRIFEHNGARHILYDRYNRVHVIYNDGVNVWYRLGVRVGGRLVWQGPVQVNDAATPISWSTYGTRGETFAVIHDDAGNAVLQCVWSSTGPTNRAILTRRLTVNSAGSITTGGIIPTGLTGSFPCIVADSNRTLHLAVELYSAITYMNSTDGANWLNYRSWAATQYNCTAYRFPNIVVDSKDHLHLLWQAEGYQGHSGSALWWVGLYAMYNPQTSTWSTPANILSGISGWQAPISGQQILFAYPNMLVDESNNLHVSWHGTARSLIYAQDDIYYMKKTYSAATDTWSGWTGYTALHKRIDPGTSDGEDSNFSWVPSMAYRPGASDLYTVFMFGTGDDEVDDPSVNLTDGGLKRYVSGSWQPSFNDVVLTTDMRSWYPNVAPRVMVDPNGRTWLDMIWVDGTKDDYNIMFRRIDLGGGLAGDANGDGYVNVGDLQMLVAYWGSQKGDSRYSSSPDFSSDGNVNVSDLQILVANWGANG